MQIATFTSILALAVSASATTVYGTLQMWYDANATCTQDTILYPEGQSLALGTLDSCEAVTPGVDGAEFQLFEGIPLTPLFGCESPNRNAYACFVRATSLFSPQRGFICSPTNIATRTVQLFSDAECKELVTDESQKCVTGVNSYRIVRL